MPNLPTSGAEYRSLVALLIVSAFIVAGGIHYQTPMLAAIAADFNADAATVGWIPTLSFGGLLLGIGLFVPLGDRVDKRALVLSKVVIMALAQALMAASPSIAVLAAGSLLTGICTSALQHFIAITAEVAHPEHRGRALGTQLTAMFSGILFARIVGGLVATHLGWRYSYMLSAALLLMITPVLWARLPNTRATTQASYRDLLRSLYPLWRGHGAIRRAMGIQFMFGICYGGFWGVAAPMLALLHKVGPGVAGLMGIPGAAGILVARPAGRMTDRVGSRTVVLGRHLFDDCRVGRDGTRNMVARRNHPRRDAARHRPALGDGRQSDARQHGGARFARAGEHAVRTACLERQRDRRVPDELGVRAVRLAGGVRGRDDGKHRRAFDTPLWRARPQSGLAPNAERGASVRLQSGDVRFSTDHDSAC